MRATFDQPKIHNIERFTDELISTTPDDIRCNIHDSLEDEKIECSECKKLQEKVKKFQTHSHTNTCAKKRKTITIKNNEGYGRKDGVIDGTTLKNISICRFQFPKFPLNETKVVRSCSMDIDENEIKSRKKDLNKIVKFLLRQTYAEKSRENLESWNLLKQMQFWKFLYEVGMFKEDKNFHTYSENEKKKLKIVT